MHSLPEQARRRRYRIPRRRRALLDARDGVELSSEVDSGDEGEAGAEEQGAQLRPLGVIPTGQFSAASSGQTQPLRQLAAGSGIQQSGLGSALAAQALAAGAGVGTGLGTGAGVVAGAALGVESGRNGVEFESADDSEDESRVIVAGNAAVPVATAVPFAVATPAPFLVIPQFAGRPSLAVSLLGAANSPVNAAAATSSIPFHPPVSFSTISVSRTTLGVVAAGALPTEESLNEINPIVETSVATTPVETAPAETSPAVPTKTGEGISAVPAAKNNGMTVGAILGVTAAVFVVIAIFSIVVKYRRRHRDPSAAPPPRAGGILATLRSKFSPAHPKPSALYGGASTTSPTSPPRLHKRTNTQMIDELMQASYAADGSVPNDMEHPGAWNAADEKRGFADFPAPPKRKPGTVSAWVRGLTGTAVPAGSGSWFPHPGRRVERPESSAGLSEAPSLQTVSTESGVFPSNRDLESWPGLQSEERGGGQGLRRPEELGRQSQLSSSIVIAPQGMRVQSQWSDSDYIR